MFGVKHLRNRWLRRSRNRLRISNVRVWPKMGNGRNHINSYEHLDPPGLLLRLRRDAQTLQYHPVAMDNHIDVDDWESPNPTWLKPPSTEEDPNKGHPTLMTFHPHDFRRVFKALLLSLFVSCAKLQLLKASRTGKLHGKRGHVCQFVFSHQIWV